MDEGTPAQIRPALRRDAERNRERILVAAGELFARRGLRVGFNDVAHHAGVGVGTVYRRFADKDALVEAALEAPARETLAVALEARAAERAWDGLELLLGQLARLLAENLGLRDLLLGETPSPLHPPRDAIAEALDHLLARAQEEGDVREGADGADVLVMLLMVTEVVRHIPQPDLYRRYVTIFLDGLRSGPGRAELAPPVAAEHMPPVYQGPAPSAEGSDEPGALAARAQAQDGQALPGTSSR